MIRISLSRYPCPVARAVYVIGDLWCLLVLRDAIAAAYVSLHYQTLTAWTHELDLRPWGESG